MQSYPVMFHFFILETSDWRDQSSQVAHACKHLHNSSASKHTRAYFFFLVPRTCPSKPIRGLYFCSLVSTKISQLSRGLLVIEHCQWAANLFIPIISIWVRQFNIPLLTSLCC
ncbi:expressed protein [Echinococcus multilocularis]|uniref:Expressed protein n=1 Tax=Echinococcus multilocularis TaxID=6211 RepID=A0A068YD75_ECHMU|nr:expressed protein [Echinococcus multilocularis]